MTSREHKFWVSYAAWAVAIMSIFVSFVPSDQSAWVFVFPPLMAACITLIMIFGRTTEGR